jgi:hypothetical protein
MPSITLTDMARMRMQAMSFFLVLFLLSSWAIQFLWNRLRTDLTFLPRLSYPRALGIIALWGLLFVLVLTMISGARELMTPGAWEKQGLTYKLAQDEPAPSPTNDLRLEWERERKLDRLRIALWKYALAHEGRLPASTSVSEIPKETWQLPDASGMRYVYVADQIADRGVKPLAYEPDLFGEPRLVLFTNGDIKRLDSQEIEEALGVEKHP